MFSWIVGLGRGFSRSCTLGRTLSSNRRKMVTNIKTNSMSSKTRPRRASTNRGALRVPSTTERGGFISSLALQWGQTSHLQAFVRTLRPIRKLLGTDNGEFLVGVQHRRVQRADILEALRTVVLLGPLQSGLVFPDYGSHEYFVSAT
jgi:hypothetical protein